MTKDFTDLRDFWTSVCEASKETGPESPVTQRNQEGRTVFDAWIGFEVAGTWYRLQLSSVKMTPRPMRPWITTTEQRDETARRITADPEGVLHEMRNSGGWFQEDYRKGLVMLLETARTPEGSPEEKAFKALFDARGTQTGRFSPGDKTARPRTE